MSLQLPAPCRRQHRYPATAYQFQSQSHLQDHESNGSPRRSWLACRRAISALQLLGFHGHRRYTPTKPPKSILQQAEPSDIQSIVLRLVHHERALCLELDMPPSATCPDDTAFTSVASSIRTELEQAASALLSGWWRMPSLDLTNHDDDKRLFITMMKLKEQIFHYHLVLLAHLPSMLQAATCNDTSSHLLGANSSRDNCIKASRDLLRRFIRLRSCERTMGYFRLLDLYAWRAATTLLLTRLLDDRQGRPDEHEQQHLSDRAMVSEAIENMQPFVEENEQEDGEDGEEEDMPGYHSGGVVAERSGTEDVLSRLLALEAGGAAVVVRYYRGLNGSCRVQHGSSGLEGGFGTDIVLHHDQTGPQACDADADGEESEEEEQDDDDDDEAGMIRAMKLRRSARWSIAPYMMRPV
ncbi:hypothetical protein B0H66DRAFT_590488 [Apodospora peruviana]|uniref:Uncharacterized protein n=1 Tax=Apodospora peruviana TaxID=516989 RepID=A0AAE0IDN9_9PEZI|nr:hypothetical protein B0H66DRAFT_590488 [Apodospora peruviana]